MEAVRRNLQSTNPFLLSLPLEMSELASTVDNQFLLKNLQELDVHAVTKTRKENIK